MKSKLKEDGAIRTFMVGIACNLGESLRSYPPDKMRRLWTCKAERDH
jgi:hypothetical protein